MDRTSAREPQIAADGVTALQPDHQRLSLLPGIAFTGFGLLLLAPLLYHVDALTGPDAVTRRLVGLSVVIAFFVVSLPVLLLLAHNWRARLLLLGDGLLRLERLFFILAHFTVALTICSMFVLIVVDARGLLFGGSVGMGMFLAGLMYACGGICRAVR